MNAEMDLECPLSSFRTKSDVAVEYTLTECVKAMNRYLSQRSVIGRLNVRERSLTLHWVRKLGRDLAFDHREALTTSTMPFWSRSGHPCLCF